MGPLVTLLGRLYAGASLPHRWSSRIRQIAFPHRVLPTDVLLNRIFFFQRTTEVNVPLFNPTENRVLTSHFFKNFLIFSLPTGWNPKPRYIRSFQPSQCRESSNLIQTVKSVGAAWASVLPVQPQPTGVPFVPRLYTVHPASLMPTQEHSQVWPPAGAFLHDAHRASTV